MSNLNAAIGVFDSGMGGLTVLRALQRSMPGQAFVYLGDTARLPYGTKTRDTVKRYALQAARRLVDEEVKAIVVACNTASATALDDLRDTYPELPIFGVVAPGAEAAAAHGDRIALLATESTVLGGAYQRELMARGVRVVRARAAPLLVALAEADETPMAIERAVVEHYLQGLAEGCDAILLGCTHFPVFEDTIAGVLGEQVAVVDSARTTAEHVARQVAATPGDGRLRYLVTDGERRFRRIGARFLGADVDEVTLIDVT